MITCVHMQRSQTTHGHASGAGLLSQHAFVHAAHTHPHIQTSQGRALRTKILTSHGGAFALWILGTDTAGRYHDLRGWGVSPRTRTWACSLAAIPTEGVTPEVRGLEGAEIRTSLAAHMTGREREIEEGVFLSTGSTHRPDSSSTCSRPAAKTGVVTPLVLGASQ